MDTKEEKLKQMTQRKELIEDLNRVINEEGLPYYFLLYRASTVISPP
jgi:hypothetical protein